MKKYKLILFSILNYFPNKISNFIIFIIGCFIYRKSYSQYGEDLIMLEYLNNKQIKKGSYLDIGGFHPRWISNTYLLHKNGYHGYIVEPDKDKLKFFYFLRGKKVKLINAAVTCSKNEYIELYKFKKNFGFSEIDTTSLEEAEKIKKKNKIDYNKVKVKNIFIDDIFKITGKVNVLNLDVEGIDTKLIKNCNINLLDPDIILFEEKPNYFVSDELLNFFKSKGYQVLFQSGWTKCFAK
jgi:FkbM family methyltransferase